RREDIPVRTTLREDTVTSATTAQPPTKITDAVLDEAERIVEGYNCGRIKLHSPNAEIYHHGPYGYLPSEVEAAFLHAAEAHRIWLVAETPEGGRDVPDCDPLTHAERCRVLLEEALVDLVRAVDAHTMQAGAA